MMLQQNAVKALSDADVTTTLHALAANLRATEAELVIYLGEVEARRLYAKAGYSSLFSFCTQALLFSEGTACRRIGTMRAVASYPALLSYLSSGKLHITAVAMLAPHLTAENHEQLLAMAGGRSKRELEWLIAELAPQADVPDAMRKHPERRRAERSDAAGLDFTSTSTEESPAKHQAAAPVTATVAVIKPLAKERVLIKFTADRSLEQKIQRAKELLAHKVPKGELEQVFAEALEALFDRLDPARKLVRKEARAKRKEEKAKKAKNAKKEEEKVKKVDTQGATGRYVAAEVRLEAWREAGGRCSYVSPEGRRCEEKRKLEFDHCQPYALGGRGELGNIRVLCRAHNTYAAFKTYGEGWGSSRGGSPRA